MRLITATILLGLFLLPTFAQVPDKIEGTRIQDFAQLLSPEQEAQLQAKTAQLKTSKDIELGIILTTTTNGVAPVDYTTEIGRKFGIGSAEGEHRGIVFLLAINDRQCFIQSSRHISDIYTDGKMASICRSMRTQLRATDYNGALLNGTDQLIALSAGVDQQQAQGIASDTQPAATSSGGGSGGIVLLFLLGGAIVVGIGIAIAVAISNRNERLERERQETEEEARRQRRETLARLERERLEKEHLEHEAWLKTPEGIADTKRKEEARLAAEKLQREREQKAREERDRKAREYAIWAATPAGIAAIALEKKQRQEREKREAEERAARQKREREEEERQRRRKRQQEEDDDRRRRSSSSSSSFGWSSSSSSSSDSGSSFGGGFGGGSDFGGGGGGDSW